MNSWFHSILVLVLPLVETKLRCKAITWIAFFNNELATRHEITECFDGFWNFNGLCYFWWLILWIFSNIFWLSIDFVWGIAIGWFKTSINFSNYIIILISLLKLETWIIVFPKFGSFLNSWGIWFDHTSLFWLNSLILFMMEIFPLPYYFYSALSMC
jgi:hypothetical protein